MFEAEIPPYPFEDEDPNHRWDPHWNRLQRHPVEVEFLEMRLGLKMWRCSSNDSELIDHLDRLITDMERGIIGIEDAITEAKRIGYRNPAFDGDMVGWLDDDFDEEDKEDKDSDEK